MPMEFWTNRLNPMHVRPAKGPAGGLRGLLDWYCPQPIRARGADGTQA
jgi:hypothetical protein